MADDFRTFDGSEESEEQVSLPSEMEELEQRLMLDAELWNAQASAVSSLTEYARKVPEEVAPDQRQTDPKLRTRDLGTLELAALDAEPKRVVYTRPRALGT